MKTKTKNDVVPDVKKLDGGKMNDIMEYLADVQTIIENELDTSGMLPEYTLLDDQKYFYQVNGWDNPIWVEDYDSFIGASFFDDLNDYLDDPKFIRDYGFSPRDMRFCLMGEYVPIIIYDQRDVRKNKKWRIETYKIKADFELLAMLFYGYGLRKAGKPDNITKIQYQRILNLGGKIVPQFTEYNQPAGENRNKEIPAGWGRVSVMRKVKPDGKKVYWERSESTYDKPFGHSDKILAIDNKPILTDTDRIRKKVKVKGNDPKTKRKYARIRKMVGSKCNRQICKKCDYVKKANCQAEKISYRDKTLKEIENTKHQIIARYQKK